MERRREGWANYVIRFLVTLFMRGSQVGRHQAEQARAKDEQGPCLEVRGGDGRGETVNTVV